MHEHDKRPAPLFEVGKPQSVGCTYFRAGSPLAAFGADNAVLRVVIANLHVSRVQVAHDRRCHEPALWPLAANPGMTSAPVAVDHYLRNMCATHILRQVDFCALRTYYARHGDGP